LFNSGGGEVSLKFTVLVNIIKGQSTGSTIIIENEWKLKSVLNERKLSFILLSNVEVWQHEPIALLMLTSFEVLFGQLSILHMLQLLFT
jgi:hypothetical protein